MKIVFRTAIDDIIMQNIIRIRLFENGSRRINLYDNTPTMQKVAKIKYKETRKGRFPSAI